MSENGRDRSAQDVVYNVGGILDACLAFDS